MPDFQNFKKCLEQFFDFEKSKFDTKSKIILISGPTASGKSEFAIKVAKKINGEIINADSMQVYKQLQILTARPKKLDKKNTCYLLVCLHAFDSSRREYILLTPTHHTDC